MAMTLETALDEHRGLLKRLNSLEQDIKAAIERENILKGRVEALDHELVEAKHKADHYLQWTAEIIRQMMNINMFVNNAMREAKIEVEKGRDASKLFTAAEDAIEKALELTHEPVHSKGNDRSIPNNKADGRSGT